MGDAEDDVHEIDVCRSDFDEDNNEGVNEDVNDNAEEDVLEGDICRSDIGGDFDEDMKNQRFVINTFREKSKGSRPSMLNTRTWASPSTSWRSWRS